MKFSAIATTFLLVSILGVSAEASESGNQTMASPTSGLRGHAAARKLTSFNIIDQGHNNDNTGWYDINNIGSCTAYCRWVGNTHVPIDLSPMQGETRTTYSNGRIEYGTSQPAFWACQIQSLAMESFDPAIVYWTGYGNPFDKKKCANYGDSLLKPLSEECTLDSECASGKCREVPDSYTCSGKKYCSSCNEAFSTNGCESGGDDNGYCRMEDGCTKPGLTCGTKQTQGAGCDHDSECHSSTPYCTAAIAPHTWSGLCSECKTLDAGLSECPEGKVCKSTSDGMQCKDKHALGEACLSDNACASGMCRGGFCSSCPNLDGVTGCNANTEYCGLTNGGGIYENAGKLGWHCRPKKGYGGTCVSNNACSSGICHVGFCVDCPNLNGLTGCQSGHFCDSGHKCSEQKSFPTPCTHDNVCKKKCYGLCEI